MSSDHEYRPLPGSRNAARLRMWALPAMDACFWAIALTGASILRFEYDDRRALTAELGWAIIAAIVSHLAIGSMWLYSRQWRIGSFEEMATLAITIMLVTTVVLVMSFIDLHHRVPVGAVLPAGAFVMVLSGGTRCTWRMIRESQLQRRRVAEDVIVFGAGVAGERVINAMLTTPDSPYVPVGLLDDDPLKRNLRIRSLRVSGGRERIAELARSTGARTMVIAIGRTDSRLLWDLTKLADDCDLSVRILPPLSHLFTHNFGLEDFRAVTDADLLGRNAVDMEVESVADYLTGRRVLVTGAGGSIGSELCRQITRFSPSELIMLDRDESGLHQVQLSIEGRALLETRSLVVCDIRDAAALRAVFAEQQPDVVFHAAALKHLPLLEMWPAEAFKTNVLGTLNLLEAAIEAKVSTFVNVSTDKAADPSSVLGYSKRIAERLTCAKADEAEGIFLSVRFGNVLSSRGSVLTTFRAQVEAGGPLTVTHPEVTRYFMTVEEAVQLVIQAGAVGRQGEVLVLDMGQPVRIDEIAKRLSREAKKPIEIVYTGLRSGEKLHETLFGESEVLERSVHPLILSTTAPPLHPSDLDAMDLTLPVDHLKEQLRFICSIPDRAARPPERPTEHPESPPALPPEVVIATSSEYD